MAHRIPTLTVIAGRGEQRVLETHRTDWRYWGENVFKVIAGALAFVCLTFALAVIMLSLGGLR